MPQIIVAGLGPGAWEQVTLEVKALLDSATTIYLRTRTHPTADHLPPHLEVRSFDYLYERETRFEDIYRLIAEELVSLTEGSEFQVPSSKFQVQGSKSGNPNQGALWATKIGVPSGPPKSEVIYCVPGHPLVGEASVRHLLALARERGVEVLIISGLSFLEPVYSALQIDPLERGLQIVDGTELVSHQTQSPKSEVRSPKSGNPNPQSTIRNPQSEEPFLFSPYSIPVDKEVYPTLAGISPTYPVLVCQIYNDRVASECKLLLLERYPPDHALTIVLNAGVPQQERVVQTTLEDMDRGHDINHLACVYLPPVETLTLVREFDTLVYIMGRLRGPGGCPWDREQTHDSIKHHLLEEAYEAVDAMDAGDPDTLAEELGDLLLQVVFHSQLAVSDEEFTLSDVIEHIAAKLIRRHPHVFGDVEVTGAEHVVRNWEAIKAQEREAKARAGRKFEAAQASEQGLEGTGLLLSVPRAMPSLERAQQLQVRAARVGFDWSNIEGVFEKVREEITELQEEQEKDRRSEELGDLLFALVNLSQWMGINAEEALRRANDKFLRRFTAMERAIVARGGKLRGMSLAEMDEVWEEVKGEPAEAQAG